MATLIVRNLDDELVRRLKARARCRGHSAEAEHRRILEAALRPRETMAETIGRWLAMDGYFESDEIEAARGAVDQAIRYPDLADESSVP